MDANIKEKLTKTGTTTISLKFKDGVVLAADKRATGGHMIMDKHAQKIHKVDDFIALTIAGLVSDAQLLTKLVRAEINLKKLKTRSTVSIKEAANLLAGLNYSNIRRMSMVPGIVGFLIAGKDTKGFCIYNIGVDGSITEEKQFASEGSGSVFAFGVLETLFKEDMNQEEAIGLAKKALNAAVQRDSASGSGFDIWTITEKGVQVVEADKPLAVKVA
jgi:proteasome beta subunit